jgi:hypothetical protein
MIFWTKSIQNSGLGKTNDDILDPSFSKYLKYLEKLL